MWGSTLAPLLPTPALPCLLWIVDADRCLPVCLRPNAVRQFFAAARRDPKLIRAPWLLLIEADYIWSRPIQPPRAESKDPSWAFLFHYIDPGYPGLEGVIR